jgi:peptidoglycan hydrolase CwlO-like protein
LNYQVKDLSRAIDRYKEESVKLEEEREVIEEKVNELEALVAKRDEEIQEMEGYLAEKERLIS